MPIFAHDVPAAIKQKKGKKTAHPAIAIVERMD